MKKVSTKLFLISLTSIVLAALIILVPTFFSISRIIDELARDDMQSSMNTVEALVENRLQSTLSAAVTISQKHDIIAALSAEDGLLLVNALTRLYEDVLIFLDPDFITVTDSNGIVLTRLHDSQAGDCIAHRRGISRAIRRLYTSDIEPDGESELGIVSTVPIIENDILLGTVSVGFDMGTTSFVDYLSFLTNAEVTVFAYDTSIMTTIVSQTTGERMIRVPLASHIAEVVLYQREIFTMETEIAPRPGELFFAHYKPFLDETGEVLGVIFTGQNLTAVRNIERRTINTAIGFTVLMVVIVYVVFKRVNASLVLNQHQFLEKEHELKMKLLEQEMLERIRTMFDAAPVLIEYWDENFKALDCNQTTLEFYEFSDKKEYISHFGRYLTCSSLEQWNTELQKIFEDGHGKFEFDDVNGKGETVRLEVEGVCLQDGEDSIVVTYSKDITQLTEAKEQSKNALEQAILANHTKNMFLANMSHELRTPLNSIVGFSELALDDEISPKTKEYLDLIQDNSALLLQIISDLLDISKLGSGEIELESIPFDLQILLSSCMAEISVNTHEKGLVSELHEEKLQCMLLGDPTMLRQVIMNLLSNAVKFTEEGIISLHAAVKNVDEETVKIYFEVKDTGIGMTPEQMKIIFDPFVQVETGMTRKFGGTGLGLAITKNTIESMGGELLVESTPGAGSSFKFELTFNTFKTDESLEPESVFESIRKPQFEGEILICEDSVMNQQVICEHLSRIGLKYIVAENGKIGVEAVEERIGKKQFDLIFMDIHMPVMDGIEASQKIFALNLNIPIVALTANIMPHDIEFYKDKGINDYLGKPFLSNELWNCLLKYFEPVAWHTENNEHAADSQLRQKLERYFVINNQNKISEIIQAINDNDFTLAHRLAHTLKSNAGQISRIGLAAAAEAVERNLSKNILTDGDISKLSGELKLVLGELAHLETVENVKVKHSDTKAMLALYEKLKPLLEDRDSESLALVDELRSFPNTEALVAQIESFNFDKALATLERVFS
ncbi:MAG: ATP-binding protein [Defluviitaleaceae bacterium]|nr:ATP-binding protein [Defluviitaleaceae bacterium]